MAESLESQIKRAERNARSKMKRITQREGVNIAQTPFNPIRMTDGLTYNQRRTYLNQLKKFNSRETTFYRDARENGLISGRDWKRYKEAEKRANDFVRQDLKKYGKVKAYSPDPTRPGMSVEEEYNATMKPRKGRLMVNPSGSGMHEVDRKPSSVMGPKGLERLRKQLEEKTTVAYRNRKIKAGREQFNKMLDAMDEDDIRQMGMALNDEQFHVLWNYTNLANSIALSYEIMMQQMERGPKEFHAGILKTTNKRARGLIEWASRL